MPEPFEPPPPPPDEPLIEAPLEGIRDARTQDDCFLPDGYVFRNIGTEYAGDLRLRKVIIARDIKTPLNDGVHINPDEGLPTAHKDYAYDTIGPLEIRFVNAWAQNNGVIETMPIWLKQLGVYRGWIEFDRFTTNGRRMCALVAKTKVAPADEMRSLLHKEAERRKQEKVREGLERQRAWNEARSKEAAERAVQAERVRIAQRDEKNARREAQKEAEGRRKAAEALAVVEAKLSVARYREGLVPVVLWVTPEQKAQAMK